MQNTYLLAFLIVLPLLAMNLYVQVRPMLMVWKCKKKYGNGYFASSYQLGYKYQTYLGTDTLVLLTYPILLPPKIIELPYHAIQTVRLENVLSLFRKRLIITTYDGKKYEMDIQGGGKPDEALSRIQERMRRETASIHV